MVVPKMLSCLVVYWRRGTPAMAARWRVSHIGRAAHRAKGRAKWSRKVEEGAKELACISNFGWGVLERWNLGLDANGGSGTPDWGRSCQSLEGGEGGRSMGEMMCPRARRSSQGWSLLLELNGQA